MTIKSIQCRLMALAEETGYKSLNPGDIDGILGSKTRNAVKAFQQAYGLNADGYPGDQTCAALKHASCYGLDVPEETQQESTDADGWRWPHFSYAEFKCKCSDPGCVGKTMAVSEALLDDLEAIRTHFGKPVTISSGIRCPAHNASVGGVSNSYHTTGKAADFNVQQNLVSEVMAFCRTLNPHYVYSIQSNGGDSGYIHIDVN